MGSRLHGNRRYQGYVVFARLCGSHEPQGYLFALLLTNNTGVQERLLPGQNLPQQLSRNGKAMSGIHWQISERTLWIPVFTS